jgi:hypothetical protein
MISSVAGAGSRLVFTMSRSDDAVAHLQLAIQIQAHEFIYSGPAGPRPPRPACLLATSPVEVQDDKPFPG